jgi:hypothetical protein
MAEHGARLSAFGLLLSLATSTHAEPFQYSGRWCWQSPDLITNSVGQKVPAENLSLSLTQSGDHLAGTHCAVALGGNRIDCAVEESDGPSIRGRVLSDHAELEFTSAYSGGKGVATLSPSTGGLRWMVTKQPASEDFLPRSEVSLTKCGQTTATGMDAKERMKAAAMIWREKYLSQSLDEACKALKGSSSVSNPIRETEASLVAICAAWVASGRSLNEVLTEIEVGAISPTEAKLLLKRLDESTARRMDALSRPK